jgi:hypothetical protein
MKEVLFSLLVLAVATNLRGQAFDLEADNLKVGPTIKTSEITSEGDPGFGISGFAEAIYFEMDSVESVVEHPRRIALLLRPLYSLLGVLGAAMFGEAALVSFSIEGQYSFTPSLSLDAMVWYNSQNGSGSLATVNIGLQLWPNSKCLDGYLIGIYPGISITSNGSSQDNELILLLEGGRQWVWESGFTLSTTAGLYFMPSMIFPNLSVGLGWAF